MPSLKANGSNLPFLTGHRKTSITAAFGKKLSRWKIGLELRLSSCCQIRVLCHSENPFCHCKIFLNSWSFCLWKHPLEPAVRCDKRGFCSLSSKSYSKYCCYCLTFFFFCWEQRARLSAATWPHTHAQRELLATGMFVSLLLDITENSYLICEPPRYYCLSGMESTLPVIQSLVETFYRPGQIAVSF